MSQANLLALILLVCAAVSNVSAFTLPTTARTSCALNAGRRDFLETAISTTAGVVIALIPSVAGAEEEEVKIADDLAMPSEEEQKKSEEEQKKADEAAAAATAEKLRRKAELQAEKARPATFQDSFKKEQAKKKGLQMSTQERRNALCEELGRGC